MSDHGQFRSVVPKGPRLEQEERALVVVDLTNFDSHPMHGFARVLSEEGTDLGYYWERVEQLVVPNSMRLVEGFRDSGGRVAYTRVGAQLDDYADSLVHLRTLHRKSGTIRESTEFDMRKEFIPRQGEIVVDKPGSGAFTTSNLDILLRNAGVKEVIFCGVVTNACVLLSALGAWDLGYSVIIVDDACASDSAEAHEAGLLVAKWLGCNVATTQEILLTASSQSNMEV